MASTITADRLALAREALADGWSLQEIYRTYRIHPTTLRRHFLGAGWTPKQGAQLGYLIMKAGRK